MGKYQGFPDTESSTVAYCRTYSVLIDYETDSSHLVTGTTTYRLPATHSITMNPRTNALLIRTYIFE